jgi:hypothetical protein
VRSFAVRMVGTIGDTAGADEHGPTTLNLPDNVPIRLKQVLRPVVEGRRRAGGM